MTSKKLQAMPYDVFTRKQAALPQFKKSYAIGQFALQETDNNSHHDEQSMTSTTDFSKNS